MLSDFKGNPRGLEGKLIHECPPGATVQRWGEVWLVAGPDFPPYTVDFHGNVTPYPKLTPVE